MAMMEIRNVHKTFRTAKTGDGIFLFLIGTHHADVSLAGFQIRCHFHGSDGCHHMNPWIFDLLTDDEA